MCGAQKLREILSWHVAGHETRSLKHQGPSAQHLKEHPEVILNEHTPNPSPARFCDAAAPQKPAYAELNSIKSMLNLTFVIPRDTKRARSCLQQAGEHFSQRILPFM